MYDDPAMELKPEDIETAARLIDEAGDAGLTWRQLSVKTGWSREYSVELLTELAMRTAATEGREN